jgi:hypothetical protein
MKELSSRRSALLLPGEFQNNLRLRRTHPQLSVRKLTLTVPVHRFMILG